MNYKEAYAWGVELLEKACVEESKIDAWYLLEYVTKISRAVFYAYPEKELTEEEKAEARQNAIRQYQDEEIQKMKNRNKKAKPTSTQTNAAPTLFDF